MMADPVAHCLDQNRFAVTAAAANIFIIGKGAFARCDSCGANGKDIVPVDADRFDAVADTAGCDPVAAILLEGRCGDGVAVVTTDEDDRTGTGGGDVEGSVEVTFGCGTFAEVASCDRAGFARRSIGL